MPEEKQLVEMLKRLGRTVGSTATLVPLGIALLLVLAVALLFPRADAVKLNYRVGGIWVQKDLIAPFAFPILRDEREYAADVESAKKGVYEVFIRDTLVDRRNVALLRNFFEDLSRASEHYRVYQQTVRSRPRTVSADSTSFSRLSSALDVTFSDHEWQTLAILSQNGRLQEMRETLASTLQGYFRRGILDRPRSEIRRSEVAIREGTVEAIVPLGQVYDRGDVVMLLDQYLRSRYEQERGELGIAYKIGITHSVPNILFDSSATQQAYAAAVDAVSRTAGFVQENERIVSKHERITPEAKLKLDSFQRARVDRGLGADTPPRFLGMLLHVAIVLTPYGIYLFLFRKRIIGSPRKLALIALLLLLVCSAAAVTRELDVTAPVEYLIVVPAASMLLTIFFDSRVGFYGTVVLAFLVAGIRGNDYSIALASLVAGALSVYSVRDMKNRTQIFRSLGFIFVGYVLTILALALERFEPTGHMLEQSGYALVNAIVSPVLSYGLLIFLERFFRLTTDLTLMELAQFNHPLLRLLAEKAPGTYHHSLSMATLAEAAAAAIGANVVLARVGAYFHDVGKVVKPTYFVENQKGSRNRHDKLAPRMSSLIIAAHVKEGIALAREYRLPQEVVDFIPMHHGTTRIDYFYNKALELARSSEDETKIDEIKESDYRYPGPKPQTKETGIMMLADAIEAAVRTIEEPTPQRIEDLVDEMVRKRMLEGELDECPLTMQDVAAVKGSFLNVLVGIYHSRVKYPEPEKKRVRSAVRPRQPTPQPSQDVIPPAGSGDA